MAVHTASNKQPGAARRFPWRALAWGSAGALLLLPLVAMQFTREVNWSPGDFVFFALMLAVAGGGFELAVRARADGLYRAAAGVALMTAFLLVWANAAVGLIGQEGDPVNAWVLVVPAVGFVTAMMARFQARGMAAALAATACAQAAVLVHAWAFDLSEGLGRTLIAMSLFIALWLLSAALFWRAARRG